MRSIHGLALFLLIAGCSGETPPEEAPTSAEAKPAAEEGPLSATALGQWTRNCTLCHVRGEGGAPVAGDEEAWAPRVAQGEETLLKNTVEGLNNMPPLGYCMDCEEEDFRQINRFMAGIER